METVYPLKVLSASFTAMTTICFVLIISFNSYWTWIFVLLNTASYRNFRGMKNKSKETWTQEGLKTLKARFYYSEAMKKKYLSTFLCQLKWHKNKSNKSIADYVHSCINHQCTYIIHVLYNVVHLQCPLLCLNEFWNCANSCNKGPRKLWVTYKLAKVYTLIVHPILSTELE